MESKYIISIVLGSIGLFIMYINWYSRYRACFVLPKLSKEERDARLGEPWIPIIGGLLVFFALIPFDIPVLLRAMPFIFNWGGVLGCG